MPSAKSQWFSLVSLPKTQTPAPPKNPPKSLSKFSLISLNLPKFILFNFSHLQWHLFYASLMLMRRRLHLPVLLPSKSFYLSDYFSNNSNFKKALIRDVGSFFKCIDVRNDVSNVAAIKAKCPNYGKLLTVHHLVRIIHIIHLIWHKKYHNKGQG